MRFEQECDSCLGHMWFPALLLCEPRLKTLWQAWVHAVAVQGAALDSDRNHTAFLLKITCQSLQCDLSLYKINTLQWYCFQVSEHLHVYSGIGATLVINTLCTTSCKTPLLFFCCFQYQGYLIELQFSSVLIYFYFFSKLNWRKKIRQFVLFSNKKKKSKKIVKLK